MDTKQQRIATKANARAQRRFSRMLSTGTYGQPEASATVLYVQAERLLDRLA